MISAGPARKRQLDQNAVPTTSLADMMFLLLIFFIMTTSLSKVTGFVSDMPSGATGKQTESKTTTVTIQNDEVRVNDAVVSLTNLKAMLKGLRLDLKTGDAKVVVVTASGKVRYQMYYEIMAEIQNAGGIVALVSDDTKEEK